MSDGDRQRLLSERALLLASLRDAAEERDAGELDEDTFTAITERDRARLAGIAEAIDRLDEAELPNEHIELKHSELEPTELEPTVVQSPDRGSWLRRHRVAGALVAGVIVVGAVVGVIVVSSPSPSTATQVATMLNQADADAAKGNVSAAIELYNKVITLDPTSAHALAGAGWLTYEAGSIAKSVTAMERGEAQVREAIKADPNLFAGHLYLGVILLLSHNDPTSALGQFKQFLALKPGASWVTIAQPYITKAADEAGVPVPTAP
jgi:tetratricopeptide (TPR) repeat protein